MIQNKKRIISLILMLTILVSALVVGAITASAAETGDKFVKVTSAPSDWSGTYLIVYESGKYAFNGDLSALDATKNMQSVEISNGEIASSDALKKMTFTIAKSGNNYTIKSASGYYIGQTSNANGLKSSKTTTYANTITINNDGSVNFVSGGAYLRFNSASDQMRFRYYKSSSYAGQKAICLYKLVEGTTSENPVCNHENAIKTDATPATCVNPGNNVYYTCECGTFLDGSKAVVNEGSWVIPALGHTGGSATCDKLAVCERCEQGYGVFADHTYVNNVCVDCGALKPNNSTITFDNTDKRVVFTGDTQVWKEDGITVTNNQATSTSEMADYSNPVRFYKSTELIVQFDGMIKMEFTCSSDAYAESLAKSIGDGATRDKTVVTVVLTKAVNEYTIKLSDGQVRMYSVKVYACTHSWQDATCTAPKTCSVCGATEGEALGHNHENCPHKAVVGETYYETLQQAIAGATAGSEIVLNSDIEVVGDLTIENQVTINLNGKTLTAGAVVTFFEGTQFIGEGKLEVAKDSLYNIKGETDYVPVWNEAGYYTFSEVKDQIKESTVEDTEVVVFRPAFENTEIKKEFVDGAGDNGLSFVISITWEGLAKPKEYTLTDEFIANVYNAEKPKAIQLGFENWQAGVEYTVTLRIVSGGIYYETILCTMKDGAITVPEIVTE